MSKTNGKADIGIEEQAKQKLEAELPPADMEDGFEEKRTPAQRTESEPSAPAAVEAPPAADELSKLRTERDNLLDRLARVQAEFDNSRKRAARENADFRDYAVAD